MPVKPWIENDELACSEMRKGWYWQKVIGAYFEAHGLPVVLDPFRFRETRADIPEFRDTPDLLVAGERIEVKSRNLKFWTPATFEYARPLVDTVSSYDAYEEKPLAYVFVSQTTGAWICTPGRRPDAVARWTIEEHYDAVRRIDDMFYTVPRSLCGTPAPLLAHLKKINKTPKP